MNKSAPRRIALVIASIATVLAMIAIATPANADDEDAHPVLPSAEHGPRPSGLRVGLRTGLAVPFGSTFGASGAITDTVTGYVPLRLDLGYRIARHFYVGAAAQLATIIPNGCTSGERCTGNDVRFGAMVAYHLRPDGSSSTSSWAPTSRRHARSASGPSSRRRSASSRPSPSTASRPATSTQRFTRG